LFGFLLGVLVLALAAPALLLAYDPADTWQQNARDKPDSKFY
jgi:hypothetical protein